MTLEVPFEGFVGAAKRLASGLPAFVSIENGGTRVTCAEPQKQLRLISFSPDEPESVAVKLRESGLDVLEGRWVPDDSPPTTGEMYVSAISYRTDGMQPGLWVDASYELPTTVQAIREMYEEFCETGQVADVPLEEFVRLAEPTVVILTPAELRGFAAAKDC